MKNLKPLTLIIPIILSPSISFSQTQTLPREIQMAYLLKSHDLNDFKTYNKLCSQAIETPKLGMTLQESRQTTWCFPYERHVTKTLHGEFAQETYLKRNSNGESDSRYSKRLYLYFINDILTTIQE